MQQTRGLSRRAGTERYGIPLPALLARFRGVRNARHGGLPKRERSCLSVCARCRCVYNGEPINRGCRVVAQPTR
jgi:hypothetical protein